jgi:hypothetical protein
MDVFISLVSLSHSAAGPTKDLLIQSKDFPYLIKVRKPTHSLLAEVLDIKNS